MRVTLRFSMSQEDAHTLDALMKSDADCTEDDTVLRVTSVVRDGIAKAFARIPEEAPCE